MGALYHLKQKLVDFCNVIQENVSRTDTVPSSKVVYDLKADSDSQISDLNDSLASLILTETTSVTTNASGYAMMPSKAGYEVLNVAVNNSSSGICVRGYIRNNSQVYFTDVSGNTEANTTIPVKIRYIRV